MCTSWAIHEVEASFRARREGPVGDQGEQHPLHHRIPPGDGGEAAQQGVDPQAVPQPVQQPRPAQGPGLNELQPGHPDHPRPVRAVRHGLDAHDAGQGGDQPFDRGPVELIGPAEGVQHLRPGRLRRRVPLVVRQLQIRHPGPVLVPAGRRTHEHATRRYTISNSS
jgi:hypothetical protein